MGRALVPVIVKNAVTGEETRYPSTKEAAEAQGVKPSCVTHAYVNGYKLHGFYYRREDDWILPSTRMRGDR